MPKDTVVDLFRDSTPRSVRTLGSGKGRDVAIVRTEPMDVAPVIPLPVRMHGNRVIEPVDALPGTRLPAHSGYDPTSYDPGPLARALMAMQAADSS